MAYIGNSFMYERTNIKHYEKRGIFHELGFKAVS